MDDFLFLDTEYTTHAAPELLALALVSMTGDEYYCELHGQDPCSQARMARSNDFVRATVLPQFGRLPSRRQCAAELGRDLPLWLAQRGCKSLHVCYDWSVDFNLLESLLQELGASCELRLLEPCNLSILNTEPHAEAAREAAYHLLGTRGLCRHHALADAWALRAAYLSQ